MNGTKRHVAVAAFLVRPGDEMEHDGQVVTVVDHTRGANGQRYVETRTPGGASVTHEFDPDQKVSVWR